MANIFGKLAEVPWYTWTALILILACGAVFFVSGKKVRWNGRRVSMAAMCIAIAFVLSCIRLYRMPQGGSVTPASMLPLVLFSMAFGALPGFAVGCVYGLLQLMTSPWIVHPVQLLLDYPFAYGAIAVCCVLRRADENKKWRLPLAVLVGTLGRYVLAVVSGTVFFADAAGEQNALIYSLLYNISYLAPDMLACMLVSAVPGMARLTRVMRG